MYTKYSIHNGRIYGPVSYTGFFIAKDGHIHDIKGDTGYRVATNGPKRLKMIHMRRIRSGSNSGCVVGGRLRSDFSL